MEKSNDTDSMEMNTQLDGSVTPSKNNVPDLVQIGQIPSNLVMDYDTTVYEPVVKSEKFLRFQIDNRGILHSNSKLTLSMGDGVQDTNFFSIGIGVNSLIERATLKCGGQTLSEIDDWANFMAYRSLFIQPENNKERESITTSRVMNYKNTYNSSGASPTSASALQAVAPVPAIQNTKGNGIGLDVGRYLNVTATGENTVLPNYLRANNKAEFQISLSDLFPFLKMNQIPLYMLRDPLFIELTLTSNSTGQRLSSVSGSSNGAVRNLDLNNISMIIDHIYYPAEQMEAYAAANPQISLSYMDYRLSKQSMDQAGALNNIRNVGGAGRIITKLIHSVTLAPVSTAVDNEQNLLNVYDSTFPITANKTVNLNVRYNNEFLYPIDVTNTARVYNLVASAEKVTPYLPRDQYNGEGAAITAIQTFETNTQSTELSGKSFWSAHLLNRGERVSARGIEVYTKYDTLTVGNYVQRVWLEYVKVATITNGIINVYNA